MATIKKVYPIEGRKDFYKFTIVATEGTKLHTDHNGNEMYFDNLDHAKNVCDAINRVESSIRNDNKETKRNLNRLYKFLIMLVCFVALFLTYIYCFPALGAVIVFIMFVTLIVKLD